MKYLKKYLRCNDDYVPHIGDEREQRKVSIEAPHLHRMPELYPVGTKTDLQFLVAVAGPSLTNCPAGTATTVFRL